MKNEFEIVSHKQINFKNFLVSMVYRTPHFHKDFEVNLLLDGNLDIFLSNSNFRVSKGDIWITNPFKTHELKAVNKPAIVLSLQIAPSFFAHHFPNMENIEFCTDPLKYNNNIYKNVYSLMIYIAYTFFKQSIGFELNCAALINFLFNCFLRKLPYKIMSIKEKNNFKSKSIRMHKIIDFIDNNYDSKLLLSEIAKRENLSLSYLSHFFKDLYGISFQEYLMKIRLEKAHKLLLTTDSSLLDISISSGFSDVKYFNSGFKKQFGYSPKEYRKIFKTTYSSIHQKVTFTTEKFLSKNMSIIILEKHFVDLKTCYNFLYYL